MTLARMLSLIVLGAGIFAIPAYGVETAPVGIQVEEFELPDYLGENHTLSDYSESPVVVLAFLGVECPLAKLYAPRLEKMAQSLEERGVTFLGIDSNRQDSVTELAGFARRFDISFPLLKDTGNKLADQLGVRRNPEVLLLDQDRVIRYRGRVDDQFGLTSTTMGYARKDVRRAHLLVAIDQVLAGDEVEVAQTETVGCLIGRMRDPQVDAAVTYSDQVSRILQQRCVECHRPGQIAPFALQEYEEVAGWAEMIAEVIRENRMPPWHADPRHGSFRNDISMPESEKELIYEWVAAGAPEGDPKNLPEPIEYPTGWQQGEPDAVFAMSDEPYLVPANGVIEYQYFVADPGWTEDVFLQATECMFGNREVVHHMFVFAVSPGVELPDFEALREKGDAQRPPLPGPGRMALIGGAAPGTPPWAYQDGMALHCEAGTKLLFQMHYTPCGREVPDISSFGVRYADPMDVRQVTRTSMAINMFFSIPPGAANHPVQARRAFDQDAMLTGFGPHMHLRGKSFRYDLRRPDGSVETLLNVPNYDFNWQALYLLDQPIFVPAGSTLECLAHFDNSEENLANPDPTATVTWGDQTYEEMMIGWFNETTDVPPDMLPSGMTRIARFTREVEENGPPKISRRATRFASKAFGSQRAFGDFAEQVRKIVPMVDRVDVVSKKGDAVEVTSVWQPPVFDFRLGEVGVRFDEAESAVASVFGKGEPVVLDRLTEHAEADVRRMNQWLASSVHFPIRIEGEDLVMSFWSREEKAFTPIAVETLRTLVEAVGK